MRTVVASFPNMRDRVDVTDSTGIASPSEGDLGLVQLVQILWNKHFVTCE
jgi:hypothetical protein